MAHVQRLTQDEVQQQMNQALQLGLPEINETNVGAILFIDDATPPPTRPQIVPDPNIAPATVTPSYNAGIDLNTLLNPTVKGIEIATPVSVPDVDVTGSVTVNPGYGIVNVVSDPKIYHAKITSNVIYFGGVKYIQNNYYKSDKMQLKCVAHPIPKNESLGYYGFYLKKIITAINNVKKMIIENAPTDQTAQYLPVYIGGTDKDARIICGCCGIYLTNDTMITAHIAKKKTMFTAWAKNKFNNCPICEVEFENNPDCIMHWFDSNHTTVATRSIIGETVPSVNDLRLQKGFGLPYTAVVQAFLSSYLMYAGVVALFLAHKATTVELANTSELASSLSVELTMSTTVWRPDCPYCDDRYFRFNSVHYRSCLSLCGNVKFVKAKCGHMIPEATADQVELLHFPWFRYMAKKMRGEIIPGSCTGYKTMARFDDFDDGSDDLNWRNYFFTTIHMSMATETNNSSSDAMITHTFSPPTHKASFALENYSRVGFMNPIFFPVDYHHLCEGKTKLEPVQPQLEHVQLPSVNEMECDIQLPTSNKINKNENKNKENYGPKYKNKKNNNSKVKAPKGRTDYFYDQKTRQYRCSTDFGLSTMERAKTIQQLSSILNVTT